MAFLKTLFWIVLTVVLVVFFTHNWTPTTITLFGDLVWQTKLPVPLLLAFLLGFGPLYSWYRFARWRDRRRTAVAVADAQSTVQMAPATPSQPSPVDPFTPDL